MITIEEAWSNLDSCITQLEELYENTSVTPAINTTFMKAATKAEQRITALRDRTYSSYEHSNAWAADGYLTGTSAITHETHQARQSVTRAIERGKLLNQYKSVACASNNGTLTTDHINYLVPFASEKYCEFFADDVDLLVESAKELSAQQFSNVVRHWKNMVDAVIDEPTDEYKAFNNRALYLHETIDGSWFLQAWLDPITGKNTYKTLEDIREKRWRDMSPEQRNEFSPAQQRVDSLGCVVQGYLKSHFSACPPEPTEGSPEPTEGSPEQGEGTREGTHVRSVFTRDSSALPQNDNEETEAKEYRFSSSPSLTADIVIDINDLDPQFSTHAFLNKCITTAAQGQSPIISTHSRKHIEQILCDTTLQVPIKHRDGTLELGRKVRTAPWRMKKQLMLQSPTCSIPGCTMPSQWCEAHHIEHWAHGGQTNIDNLALLCSRHHTMMHNDKTFAQKTMSVLKQHPPP